MHLDAVLAGEKVFLVDDLIATGGTALAAVQLLKEAGAPIVAAAFVIDLPELGGAAKVQARRRAGSRRSCRFEGHAGTGNGLKGYLSYFCSASPHWADGSEQIGGGSSAACRTHGLRGRRVDLRSGGDYTHGPVLRPAARRSSCVAHGCCFRASISWRRWRSRWPPRRCGGCCASTCGSPSAPASAKA